jgi:hypothetical protein
MQNLSVHLKGLYSNNEYTVYGMKTSFCDKVLLKIMTF